MMNSISVKLETTESPLVTFSPQGMFLFSPHSRYSLFTENKDLELILELIYIDKCLL